MMGSIVQIGQVEVRDKSYTTRTFDPTRVTFYELRQDGELLGTIEEFFGDWYLHAGEQREGPYDEAMLDERLALLANLDVAEIERQLFPEQH